MILISLQFLILENSGFIFVIGFGVIIFLILSYVYSKKNRMLRKLKEYQFKRFQLCKDNEYIKIKGKALPIEKALTSPLGNKKCVYYKIEIKEKQSNGKSSSWRTILKEEKFQDFIIESQGDKAIVMAETPKHNKITYLNKDVEYTSGTWNDAPKILEDYLASHGRKSTGFLGFNKSLRYLEGAIEIGETITVAGIANWKESDHNYDRYSSKSLYISGIPKNKLIITDLLKAQESKK